MQNSLLKLPLVLFFIFLSLGCQHNETENVDWTMPFILLEGGELNKVKGWADSIKKTSVKYDEKWMKADSLARIAKRIAIDFKISESEVREQLVTKVGEYTEEEWSDWNSSGLLEGRVLDGEMHYFKRAASNLAILTGRGDGLLDKALDAFCLKHSEEVLDEIDVSNRSRVKKQNFVIDFVVSVDKDAVPAGDTIRCWLPFPKELHGRQTNVKLINVTPGDYILSNDTCVHRSVYVEQLAVAGEKTEFRLKFSFDAQAEYIDLSKHNVLPYDEESAVFKEYTKEQLPHIAFTHNIKHLADSICGDTSDPVAEVRDIYYWIDKNIPWAGALEYGIMPNIPEYVLKNRKGDCGMQTLLFMAMARYRGIPVRWQSGWMLHPGEENLHDWCEVYYEGVGWVPLDMSFGLQQSEDHRLREFYISGIDAWRLIINDGIGAQFCPSKVFLRSEPWDFQRGEVEWKEGNLYFNHWDYHLSVSRQ
ncbi:transglutaminase-like domain-containing protein [Carboxylicivirga sp. RSCT41]|uniref:transglutaminase-like domain-containing protein n=1 Tax=Carboxylicivirga agarovorans TaxID=3417570 RepID=UPI003D35406B